MNGHFVPEGIDWSRGPLFAATHDPFLLQFLHRWWAWVVVAVLVLFARQVKPLSRRASIAIHAAFGTQILLGIFTILSGIALWLAVLTRRPAPCLSPRPSRARMSWVASGAHDVVSVYAVFADTDEASTSAG